MYYFSSEKFIFHKKVGHYTLQVRAGIIQEPVKNLSLSEECLNIRNELFIIFRALYKDTKSEMPWTLKHLKIRSLSQYFHISQSGSGLDSSIKDR